MAALPALINAGRGREFLPRAEPHSQSKLCANCQSSLTVVVLSGFFSLCHYRYVVNPLFFYF